MNPDLSPFVTGGLVGAIVLIIRELVPVLAKVVAGFSGRTGRLREQQAMKLAEAQDDADREAANRRSLQEYASRLRIQLLSQGVEPLPEPVIETTQDRSVLPTPRRKKAP